MKTTRKTDRKTSLKKKKMTEAKKPKLKSGDQVKSEDQKIQNSFIEDQEEFGVPLDELENFDTFNEYDDEDDF
jgi:hypothetical protein